MIQEFVIFVGVGACGEGEGDDGNDDGGGEGGGGGGGGGGFRSSSNLSVCANSGT